MEEDIEYLKRHIKAIGKTRSTEAIENLINKNKELEKERGGIYADYQELGKEKLELETMVELMADRLSYDAFYMDDASEYCEVKKKECDCYQNKLGCKECLLDYFRKKAKGE